MPRSARIVLPNTPHHIVQRGHNRQTVFVSDDDYNYYRDNLIFFKKKFEYRIYAYCLMTNHVHLVVGPGPNPESLSLLMKRVAGRQTRYVNKLEKRTGSLWEGRFKSSNVSQREYSVSCLLQVCVIKSFTYLHGNSSWAIPMVKLRLQRRRKKGSGC